MEQENKLIKNELKAHKEMLNKLEDKLKELNENLNIKRSLSDNFEKLEEGLLIKNDTVSNTSRGIHYLYHKKPLHFCIYSCNSEK